MSCKILHQRLLISFVKKHVHLTRVTALLSVVSLVLSLYRVTGVAASSWGPTLLVNTEAFQSIDDTDSSADVVLKFGDSLAKTLTYERAEGQFKFDDDLEVVGTVSGSSLHAQDGLTSSGTLVFEGAASGSSLYLGDKLEGAGLLDCDDGTNSKLLWDATTGRFSCGTDQSGGVGGGSFTGTGALQAFFDNRYVNTAGDSMTGSLLVGDNISGALLRANNMTVSGAIVYSSGNTLMQSEKGLSGQLLISQGTSAPMWATPIGGMIWYFGGTQAVATTKGPQITMPFPVSLSGVTLTAKGAPTGAAYIIDVNMDGASIFATRPQIDALSTTGGTTAIFSNRNIPKNSMLTLDIDQVGSTFAGSGVTIMLTGTRKY